MKIVRHWPTIFTAILGGLLFYFLSVPAGALVGSMLVTAIIELRKKSEERLIISDNVKKSVRICMGTLIGLGITAEGFYQVRFILWPAMFVTLALFVLTILMVVILHKLYNFGITDALLSSFPAGLSEMSMNATDFKADPVTVTTMHMVRLISIVVLIPIILKIIIHFM